MQYILQSENEAHDRAELAAHLGMFYLKLSHFYEVLPEGHDTSALETGEFYEKNMVREKRGLLSEYYFTHTHREKKYICYTHTHTCAQTFLSRF